MPMARNSLYVLKVSLNTKQHTAPPDCRLFNFRPLTMCDVTATVRGLPDKQLSTDPISTRLLKNHVDLLAPYLVDLFNRCLATSSVPSMFKLAYIMPLLKKSDLNSADLKSYRPIANLSVLLKLLERLVARQVLDYVNSMRLLPHLQLAF